MKESSVTDISLTMANTVGLCIGKKHRCGTEKKELEQLATMSKSSQGSGNVGSTKKLHSSKIKFNEDSNNTTIEEPRQSEAPERNQKMSLVDADFSPLSGIAFYSTVLQKVHFKPLYQMILPVRLHQYLPSELAPATVTCRGKTWEMMFHGDSKLKRLDCASWRNFVEENELKMGDALFWEVMEDSKDRVNLKVQIIKGDWPLELEGNGSGSNPKDPITIC